MRNIKILAIVTLLPFLSCESTGEKTPIPVEKELLEKPKSTTVEYYSVTVNGITSDSMIGRNDNNGMMHGRWAYYSDGEIFCTDYFLNGKHLFGQDTLKALDIDLSIPTKTKYSAPK